jgi:hypothetical protein
LHIDFLKSLKKDDTLETGLAFDLLRTLVSYVVSRLSNNNENLDIYINTNGIQLVAYQLPN